MTRTILAALLSALSLACSADDPAPSPPCDQRCLDANALRGLRETLKLVYNLTLQTNPVGEQDERTPCPLGGEAHVFGTATSDALRGTSEVELTYELSACIYLEIDEEPEENYELTFTGTVEQVGTIAVQPSVTSALSISSPALTLSGTVYDPPVEYHEDDCEIVLAQSGSTVSGTICGRRASVDL